MTSAPWRAAHLIPFATFFAVPAPCALSTRTGMIFAL